MAGEPYPEDAIVKQRKSSRRKARLRALGAIAAIGAAAAIGWKVVRKDQ
jgi:ferric-dicitrate binding protein FerR (iron transport regulator)